MILRGTIKFINYKSKFGFIKVIDTGDEIYFSTNGINEILKENDSVTFDIIHVRKGPKATNIRKVKF